MDPETKIKLFNGTILSITVILLAIGIVWWLRIVNRDIIVPYRKGKAVSNISKPKRASGADNVSLSRLGKGFGRSVNEALRVLTVGQMSASQYNGSAQAQYRQLKKSQRWGGTPFRRFIYHITHWRRRS